MKDEPLPFGRVLLGAAVGMAFGALVLRLLQPAQDPLLWACPIGAVLGVRWAARAGGTARWTALLASLLIWWGARWVLFEWWNKTDRQPFYAVHLAVLLGGWSVLVWRALVKLDGRPKTPGPLSLVLIGIFVDRLFAVGGIGLVHSEILDSILPRMPKEMIFVSIGCAFALGLTCGLGSLCALAGDLDIPWAKAAWTSGVLGVLILVNILILDNVPPAPFQPWSIQAVWLLLESAWFLWWARRMTASMSPPCPPSPPS